MPLVKNQCLIAIWGSNIGTFHSDDSKQTLLIYPQFLTLGTEAKLQELKSPEH